MTNLLEFDNIHYAYPNCPESLSGVTFSIKKGARVALVGPNGAGKTTLLLMCNGVLEPSKGRVLLNGELLRYDSRSLREVTEESRARIPELGYPALCTNGIPGRCIRPSQPGYDAGCDQDYRHAITCSCGSLPDMRSDHPTS